MEEKKKKYLLILPMSNLSKELYQTNYKCPVAGELITTSGYQLEPVPLYLHQHNKLDAVLMINTKATAEKKDNKNEKKDNENEKKDNENEEKDNEIDLTLKDFNKQEIAKKEKVTACGYLRGILEDIGIEVLDPYVLENERFASQKDVDKIIEIIKGYAKKTRDHERLETEILMDIHGGPRTNVEIMTTLFSLLPLENIQTAEFTTEPLSIKPENIYTVHYNPNETDRKAPKENEILVAKEGYELLDLVSGVHEFIDYGRTNSLKKYATTHPEIKKVVYAMEEIDNGLSMGHIKTFEKGVEDLDVNLGLVKKKDKDSDDQTTDILYRLVKQEYKVILDNKNDVTKQILWNNDKQFYQFAMTLCESKMMDYMQEQGIIDFEEITKNAEKERLKETRINSFLVNYNNNENNENAELNLDAIQVDGFNILYFNPGSKRENLFGDDFNKMFFFCCKENEFPNSLFTFLKEHRKIKNTRNNANHAGTNTKDLYEDVESLSSAIKRYITAANDLIKNNAHFTLYSFRKNDTYQDFLERFKGAFVSETVFDTLASKISKKSKKKKAVIKKTSFVQPNSKIEKYMDTSELFVGVNDVSIQEKRLNTFLSQCKENKNSKEYKIYYFKPTNSTAELFKGDSSGKCYFLCANDQKGDDLKRIVTNLRQKKEDDINIETLDALFKIYAMTRKQTYEKFCSLYGDNVINENTYLELKSQVFQKKENPNTSYEQTKEEEEALENALEKWRNKLNG